MLVFCPKTPISLLIDIAAEAHGFSDMTVGKKNTESYFFMVPLSRYSFIQLEQKKELPRWSGGIAGQIIKLCGCDTGVYEYVFEMTAGKVPSLGDMFITYVGEHMILLVVSHEDDLELLSKLRVAEREKMPANELTPEALQQYKLSPKEKRAKQLELLDNYTREMKIYSGILGLNEVQSLISFCGVMEGDPEITKSYFKKNHITGVSLSPWDFEALGTLKKGVDDKLRL